MAKEDCPVKAPTEETLFQEMLRYVRFQKADEARLQALLPLARPRFDGIAQRFYERIREHEGAHAVFQDESQILRLQRSLAQWMERLLSCERNEAYFLATSQIGRVHVRVGLPQRYMFLAMALIRHDLLSLIKEHQQQLDQGTDTSLGRALDLELAVMLDSYAEHFVNRIRNADRLAHEDEHRSLIATNERQAGAVELAQVLIVGLTNHGEIRSFNREAERVSGFGRDEVIGQHFVKLFCPPDAAEEFEKWLQDRSKEDATLLPAKHPLKTRSGKLRSIRWQPKQTQSDPTFFFLIGRDITDELALERRARQSEKLAAVGTLATGLAHEIRNPLNGAHLHLMFLERSLRKSPSVSTEATEVIHTIQEEIKRLSMLVTEFLDFARPRPLQLSKIQVNALLDRVKLLCMQEAAHAEISLEVSTSQEPLVLQGDAAKIEQVLLNLARNAIEALMGSASPSKDVLEASTGSHVSSKAEPSEKAPESSLPAKHVILRAFREPHAAIIEVEDNGPGIPSESAPIFDAFYSTKPHGTGLGLSIAHRIVHDHEGSLSFRSRPGQTVFQVSLPLFPLTDPP